MDGGSARGSRGWLAPRGRRRLTQRGWPTPPVHGPGARGRPPRRPACLPQHGGGDDGGARHVPPRSRHDGLRAAAVLYDRGHGRPRGWDYRCADCARAGAHGDLRAARGPHGRDQRQCACRRPHGGRPLGLPAPQRRPGAHAPAPRRPRGSSAAGRQRRHPPRCARAPLAVGEPRVAPRAGRGHRGARGTARPACGNRTGHTATNGGRPPAGGVSAGVPRDATPTAADRQADGRFAAGAGCGEGRKRREARGPRGGAVREARAH